MAKSESRGLRDEMNVGPDPRQARHLIPLTDLKKFRVAEGEPDVRGWDVYTTIGREIGSVHDLLVDTGSGEVVMLDVDLKRDNRHTLAPIRATWIDRATRRVVIDAKEVTTGDELPSYVAQRPLTDDEARTFGEQYDRAYGERGWNSHEYRARRGPDGLRFGRRPPSAEERAPDRDVTPPPQVDTSREPPRRSTFVERYPITEEEERQLAEERDRERDIRFPRSATGDRPVVEEVVVRRRELRPDEEPTVDEPRPRGDEPG
ncbi:MAG TPA: PRC-barrel domain-containing protein [Gemmatimonadaceae bacterium]|nr:PRC-barrel domain-containing protein [Gemmatimonadaceae bacterium]